MSITIVTRVDNKLEYLVTNSHELRIKRMKRKLSVFFDLIKHDSRYAKNNKSKGKYMPVFITLTYEKQELWDAKQISELIAKYKKHFCSGGKKALMKAEDFRYLWVAELQKRGVIHYHLVLWLPRFMPLKGLKPDVLGWWKTGFSNVVAVKKSVFAYLQKYLSKGVVRGEDGKFKTFPKGARIYGSGGLTKLQRIKTAYKLLPRWVTRVFTDDEVRIRRIEGGFKQGRVELVSPYKIEEGKDWRDIVYKKSFSMIEDKQEEIEWDRKIEENHQDVRYHSMLRMITFDDVDWIKYKLRAM